MSEAQDVARGDHPEPAHERERVLLIDDDVGRRSHLHGVFASLGYRHVHEVADPAEALVVLSEHVFDLVVTDQRTVPGGIELVRRLRAHPDGLKRATPVILVTARSEAVEPEEPGMLRIDALLHAPIDASALEAAISRALAHKRDLRRH